SAVGRAHQSDDPRIVKRAVANNGAANPHDSLRRTAVTTALMRGPGSKQSGDGVRAAQSFAASSDLSAGVADSRHTRPWTNDESWRNRGRDSSTGCEAHRSRLKRTFPFALACQKLPTFGQRQGGARGR